MGDRAAPNLKLRHYRRVRSLARSAVCSLDRLALRCLNYLTGLRRWRDRESSV
jgi:hypothetical protein